MPPGDPTAPWTRQPPRLMEKLDQRRGGRVRGFLGEIMPTVERKAAHVSGPFLPGDERPFRFGRNPTVRAPDRQHRAGDPVSGCAVNLVVGEIGGAAGTVILAGGVNAQPIAVEGVIVRESPRIEYRERLLFRSARNPPVKKIQRVLADHRLRKWCG